MSFGGKARREEARRSQKRDNLSTLRKQKVSHVESATWEDKAQKDFDAWFFGLPKKSQADLRAQGVIPYREMPDPRRKLAPLFEKSSKFVTHDTAQHEEQAQFISRDRVLDLVRAILKSMSTSASPEVRLHFELVRMALRMEDAMRGEDLGRLYNLGRAGINYRVQQMRESIGKSLASLVAQNPYGNEQSDISGICDKTVAIKDRSERKEETNGVLQHGVPKQVLPEECGKDKSLSKAEIPKDKRKEVVGTQGMEGKKQRKTRSTKG